MNTVRDDTKLLEAAEAIASHQAVDWEKLGAGCDDGVLSCLKLIEGIAHNFPAAAGSGENDGYEVGSCWHHLTIKGMIGAGGDGRVYRAYDHLLNRDVALKLSRAGSLPTKTKLAEGQRMAQVDHPNVLKVHGIAEDDGHVGLWCDLIDGEPLSTTLRRGTKFGSAELVGIGLELCAALAAIHGVGLVHGDIKPSNVVRSANGRYVLVDFGSSVRIGEVDRVRGTPLYSAPEVLLAASPSVAGDIYSLGALLFHLATGDPPVRAEGMEELLAQHQQHVHVSLFDRRPDLPRPLLSVIDRALDWDTRNRPRTAGEFASSLAACMPSERKHRSAIGSLLVCFSILLTLLVAWQFWPSSPKDELQLARFVRTSGQVDAPLTQGGTIAPGDTFALDLVPPTSLYAYVLDEDQQGETFQLFPLKDGDIKNPLLAKQSIRLPGRVAGKTSDWLVTSHGGTERLYVLLSRQPIAELESGQKLDLASFQHSTLMADALALGPLRGAGGLSSKPMNPKPTSALRLLIEKLRQRDPGLHVEQLDLGNP